MLNNKLKDSILGKFKFDNKVIDIHSNNNVKYANKQNEKNKQTPYDDVYTTDNILHDDTIVKRFAASLPMDKDTSSVLPAISEILYKELDDEYASIFQKSSLVVPRCNYYVKLNDSHPFSIHSKAHVYLVIYKIDNSNTNHPYLSFILNKNNNQQNKLSFPEIQHPSEDELKLNCIEHIHMLFGKSINMLPTYKGYKPYGIDYYLFYDASRCHSNTIMNWITVHEIVNDKKYLNQEIDAYVSNYFLNNPDIITLYTLDDFKIETPIVGYCRSDTDEIEHAKLTSYHYFYSSLADAINHLEMDEIIYRFVIFKGKTIILSNADSKNKDIINDILNNNTLVNTIYYEKMISVSKTIYVIIVKHTSQIMPASNHLIGSLLSI